VPSYEKLPSGKTRAVWYAQGKRYSKAFDTEREARAYGRAFESETQRRNRRIEEWAAGTGGPTGPDVAEYGRMLISDPELKPESRKAYESSLDKIRGTELGRTPVGRVTTGQVREFLNGVAKSRPSVYALLSKIFNSAIADEYLTVSPLRKLKISRPKYRRGEGEPLTAEQVQRLVKAAASPRDALMYQLGVFAGLRGGEVGGLKPEDVDRTDCRRHGRPSAKNGCRLVVRHNSTGGGRIGTPKGNRPRTITVPCELVDALVEYVAENPPGPQGTVFRTEWGHGPNARTGLVTDETVTDAIVGAAERAGLPRITFKILRVTCASLLHARNVPPKSIQQYLGHATLAETMETYARVFSGEDVAAAESLAGIWNGDQ
jgi:integrase